MPGAKTTHQYRVEEFLSKAGHTVRTVPTIPEPTELCFWADRIFEEATETLRAMGYVIVQKAVVSKDDTSVVQLARDGGLPTDLIQIVDRCCDVKFVMTGLLSACGVADMSPQRLIDQANLTKFDPPKCKGCGTPMTYHPDNENSTYAGQWTCPKGMSGDKPMDYDKHPVLGKSAGPYKRADGKWIKPPYWVAPDLQRELFKQNSPTNHVWYSKPNFDPYNDADIRLGGVHLVMWERRRQIEQKGFDDNHDDQRSNGELLLSAMKLCARALVKRRPGFDAPILERLDTTLAEFLLSTNVCNDKKEQPDIVRLAKAGALISAEIDRLRRFDKTDKQVLGMEMMAMATDEEPWGAKDVQEFRDRIVSFYRQNFNAPVVCPKCQSTLILCGGRDKGGLYESGLGCYDCEGYTWVFPDNAKIYYPKRFDPARDAVPSIRETPSKWAMERAAQAWCAPTTQNKVMDPVLCEEFARILDLSSRETPRMNTDEVIVKSVELLKSLDAYDFRRAIDKATEGTDFHLDSSSKMRIHEESKSQDFATWWAAHPELHHNSQSEELAHTAFVAGRNAPVVGEIPWAQRAGIDPARGNTELGLVTIYEEPVKFMYRNHRGELSERTVIPRGVAYGVSKYHGTQPNWFLIALDKDRNDIRTFVLDQINDISMGPSHKPLHKPYIQSIAHAAEEYLLVHHPGWYAVMDKPTAQPGQPIQFVSNGRLVAQGTVSTIYPPGTHDKDTYKGWWVIEYNPEPIVDADEFMKT